MNVCLPLRNEATPRRHINAHFRCIEMWLKSGGGKCPQCNRKAKMGDIRVIYAKAISVQDTTKRLEEEKQMRANIIQR